MEKKKILIIASYAGSLAWFRGDLMKCLVKNGFEVFTAAPDYTDTDIKDIKTLGATPLQFDLQRTGLNPFKDFKSIMALKSLIKDNHIDLVFPYTVKPVIYGSMAANLCKVPVVSLITGLGYTFSGLSTKSRILQKFNEALYKLSIRKNKIIVFQNKDDHQLFLDRKVIPEQQRVAFISGSGVNLDRFSFKEKNVNGEVSFLLVARLIKEKGIALYMEAAKLLKTKYPNAAFHLIGAPETSPSAIDEDELKNLHEQGIIFFHGPQTNVAEHLHKRDIFVLPSYYREGLPRTTLEACACGNPIITTDSVGCREAVKEGINGFLVKPQDLESLINAMEYFINNPDKIKEMGLNSRKYAEERFDVNIINNDLVELIKSAI